MNTKLTIIILTFNSARTIGRCLDSLLVQTDRHFTVLIVDDASTDDTMAIVDKYREGTALDIAVVFNGSHSISRGRNIGLKNSTTALVAFMDSDDYADPQWVASIRETFRPNPSVGLLSGFLVSVGQTVVGEAIATVDKTIRRFFGKGATGFCTANSAFNKDVVGDQGYFDEDFKFSEDMEIASRLQRPGRWLFVPEMKIFQNSRSTFDQYAVQMYTYGTWRVFYGFKTHDYRLVDYVPLALIVGSIVLCVFLQSWFFLLAIVFFSLLEAIFVIAVSLPKISITLLVFPVWLVKNISWSMGVLNGLAILFISRHTRMILRAKKV